MVAPACRSSAVRWRAIPAVWWFRCSSGLSQVIQIQSGPELLTADQARDVSPESSPRQVAARREFGIPRRVQPEAVWMLPARSHPARNRCHRHLVGSHQYRRLLSRTGVSRSHPAGPSTRWAKPWPGAGSASAGSSTLPAMSGNSNGSTRPPPPPDASTATWCEGRSRTPYSVECGARRTDLGCRTPRGLYRRLPPTPHNLGHPPANYQPVRRPAGAQSRSVLARVKRRRRSRGGRVGGSRDGGVAWGLRREAAGCVQEVGASGKSSKDWGVQAVGDVLVDLGSAVRG